MCCQRVMRGLIAGVTFVEDTDDEAYRSDAKDNSSDSDNDSTTSDDNKTTTLPGAIAMATQAVTLSSSPDHVASSPGSIDSNDRSSDGENLSSAKKPKSAMTDVNSRRDEMKGRPGNKQKSTSSSSEDESTEVKRRKVTATASGAVDVRHDDVAAKSDDTAANGEHFISCRAVICESVTRGFLSDSTASFL